MFPQYLDYTGRPSAGQVGQGDQNFQMFEAEISEKHFSTLETRMRISHIQSRTSRREREFLSPNLMLRDKTENNFLQSQASRRDRDLFFLISDYETRTRLGPREKINLILTRIFEIDNYRYALLWFFTGVVSMR